MDNLIACRIASYGKFQDRGWSHLPTLGIRHVEVPVPAPGETDALRRRLTDHGLTATSLQGKCNIALPDAADSMRPQIQACAELGVRICFLSVKGGDLDRNLVWSRMRAIGDLAAAAGVTIVMETHPDLMSNGDVGRATIEAINHPHVRVNFDTANIHYYNEHIDTVEELKKLLPYVAAVHLKDTNGGYKTWHFPALGEGIVDFPEVFRLLNARGFTGPFTMELEGVEGRELDEAGQLQMVADSVAHLRQIGALK